MGAWTGRWSPDGGGDWGFVDAYERCQLEVRPAAPHSINASCYTHAGSLFVGSLKGDVKRWPTYVAEDPRARVRIGGRVFELRAVEVTDPDARLAIARSRALHRGDEPGPDFAVADDYRIWRLESRGSASPMPSQSRGTR